MPADRRAEQKLILTDPRNSSIYAGLYNYIDIVIFILYRKNQIDFAYSSCENASEIIF